MFLKGDKGKLNILSGGSRASEKEWGDGCGHQQEGDSGTSGHGTVTQVISTAKYGSYTVQSFSTTLSDDTCKTRWKNLSFNTREPAFTVCISSDPDWWTCLTLHTDTSGFVCASYQSRWGRNIGPWLQDSLTYVCRFDHHETHMCSILIHMLEVAEIQNTVTCGLRYYNYIS